MSDVTSKRDQFSRRLDEIAKKGATADDAPPGEQTLEARMLAWEAALDRQLEAFRQAPAPQPASRPAAQTGYRPAFARTPETTIETWLADLDQMMLQELELERIPLPAGFSSPARAFATSHEMRQALAQANGAFGLPEDFKHPGVVHIPGRGTLIDLEHYRSQHGLNGISPENIKAHAQVLGEAARQRWGWGYLLEYTTIGQKAGQAGLWNALTAHHLGLPCTDARLAAQARALQQTWMLTQAGWDDWVWQFVMFKARNPAGHNLVHRPRPGRWLELGKKVANIIPLEDILEALKIPIYISIKSLWELLQFLFLEESEIMPQTLNAVLAATQKYCAQHDHDAMNMLQEPFSRFIGRMVYAKMEANIGIQCIPYAVLVACHPNDLPLDSPERLLQAAAASHLNNPDTRLNMLSNLDTRVKYDPKAMFIAAWERLKLDGPRGIF